MSVRLGAVEYLNARPLVYGLESLSDLFTLRFDVPAKCAALLHEGKIDLGLIPSIEYLQRPDYCVVPGIAIASKAAVASVALYTKRPTTAIRSIAVDSSSRTSIALLRILCAKWFDVEPNFIKMSPDLSIMHKRCDAALLIGDRALYTEHETTEFEKIDLGEEWQAMTSLPFVWAFWVGRQNILSDAHIEALRDVRDRAVSDLDSVVDKFKPENADDDLADLAHDYLHKNVYYKLDEQEQEGLKRFFREAVDLGIMPTASPLRFY